jgi:hypothetical protein
MVTGTFSPSSGQNIYPSRPNTTSRAVGRCRTTTWNPVPIRMSMSFRPMRSANQKSKAVKKPALR